jgi:hypothetical protein
MLNEKRMLMFTDISWATYLTLLGLATFTWYLALGYIQYYGAIKNFLNGKRNMHFSPFYDNNDNSTASTNEPVDHLTAKGTFDEPALHDFETIEELVERVKATIGEAIRQQNPKTYLLSHLGNLLRGYPSLFASQFRPSVSEFICSECEAQELAGITMEEVEALWPN